MDPHLVFGIVTPGVMPFWLLLALAPRLGDLLHLRVVVAPNGEDPLRPVEDEAPIELAAGLQGPALRALLRASRHGSSVGALYRIEIAISIL